jgi:DMSO/TMAO reductase YedYZ molybdopterin-dependent catalytic subunit
MDGKKRRFVKTLGTSIVIVGAGIAGIPLGCKPGRPNEVDGGFYDIERLDPDTFKDLSEEETRALLDQIREAQEQDLDFIDSGADSAGLDSSGNDASEVSDSGGEKPRVPPGQAVLEAIPVLGQNPTPRSLENWRFHVRGEVQQELELSWNEFNQLQFIDQVSDLHCVTGWTVLDTQWRGVRVKHLLQLAGLTGKSNFVVFDCEHEYTTSIPISEAQKNNVLIGTELFGQALPQKYGGPARGLVPDKYLYKSGKWVMGLRVLESDELGFWETKGYSNTADPWTEDRYA